MGVGARDGVRDSRSESVKVTVMERCSKAMMGVGAQEPLSLEGAA